MIATPIIPGVLYSVSGAGFISATNGADAIAKVLGAQAAAEDKAECALALQIRHANAVGSHA